MFPARERAPQAPQGLTADKGYGRDEFRSWLWGRPPHPAAEALHGTTQDLKREVQGAVAHRPDVRLGGQLPANAGSLREAKFGVRYRFHRGVHPHLPEAGFEVDP